MKYAIMIHRLCPICAKDPEVACPRDIDAVCQHCGEGYCAHHVLGHLKDKHCVSVEWRGFLKDNVDHDAEEIATMGKNEKRRRRSEESE